MNSDRIQFTPIGIIHTPFNELSGMPIQPSSAQGIKGTIELNKNYMSALDDLTGFSHIYLIYYFHKSKGFKLKVKPFLENNLRGLFATRAPARPNAIGISVVKLNSIQENILNIENVDMLDGTPLLDIKPYIGQIEPLNTVKLGWLESHYEKFETHKSDHRFEKM